MPAPDASSPAGVTRIGTRFDERRQALLRRLVAAQNRGDIDAVLDCFAYPRYELVGNSRVYDGEEAVRRYFDRTRHHFPDLGFEVVALHHSDDAVTAEMWMSGTHLGSGRDVEATGKRFRCRSAVIFSFDEDRLTGARVYYDTGTIARQLA